MLELHLGTNKTLHVTLQWNMNLKHGTPKKKLP